MGETIVAIILLFVSAAAFLMSIRAFQQKGFLFNNAYLYASKKEREAMDKEPYYKQSAVVFAAIGLIFLVNGVGLLLHISWAKWIVAAIVVVTLIYAVASSITIEKQKKNP